MPDWTPIPGETPISDLSFLKVKGITTRRELIVHEAENIRKATIHFLAERPTRKSAPFVKGLSNLVRTQVLSRCPHHPKLALRC